MIFFFPFSIQNLGYELPVWDAVFTRQFCLCGFWDWDDKIIFYFVETFNFFGVLFHWFFLNRDVECNWKFLSCVLFCSGLSISFV